MTYVEAMERVRQAEAAYFAACDQFAAAMVQRDKAKTAFHVATTDAHDAFWCEHGAAEWNKKVEAAKAGGV